MFAEHHVKVPVDLAFLLYATILVDTRMLKPDKTSDRFVAVSCCCCPLSVPKTQTQNPEDKKTQFLFQDETIV